MVGGWIVTVWQLRVASSVYWNSVVQGLYIQDVWMGLIKPFFLGFAIVSIGCHVGLRTTGGTQGVGRATTNAVVASSVAVIAVDYLVTQLLIVADVLMATPEPAHRAGAARRGARPRRPDHRLRRRRPGVRREGDPATTSASRCRPGTPRSSWAPAAPASRRSCG